MALFKSKRCLNLKGINDTKHLTSEKDVLTLDNEYCKNIYLPIVDSKAAPINLKVKIGDEVKAGTLVGSYLMFGNEIPVYSPVSGVITAEEMLFHGGIGRPVKHFVIENDFKYEKTPVCEPFTKEDSPEVIVEAMHKLGCVGFGGAGFPTFIKYKGVKDIDTIVINGVECEPFLTTDYKAMIAESDNLCKGVELMMKASGASKAFICFKKNKVHVKEALEKVVNNYQGIELKLVKDVYPMGWEKLLVKTVTGRDYERLPAEAHVIVNNAQTAIELAKSSVTGCIVTHKQITVSGDGIKENANIVVPIGTKVANIVQAMGGYTVEEGVVLLGGPMCSKGLMNDNVAITSNVNGLTILKKTVRKAQTCLRCGACTDHCPTNIQPVEVKIAVETKNMERLAALNPNVCIGCGLCSYICPSHIEVNDFVRKGKLLLSVEEAKKKAQKGGK